MPLEIEVRGMKFRINIEAIDRDIAELEAKGQMGRYEDGIFRSPRPDRHGLLKCLRDLRQYDPQQIEQVCLSSCPYNIHVNPIADDAHHLDDCCWNFALKNKIIRWHNKVCRISSLKLKTKQLVLKQKDL